MDKLRLFSVAVICITFFIFAGSQIINMMLLVVDINKGIQTQTAECIVIGEIMCPNVIVVLNKIDMVPESKRQQTILKVIYKNTFLVCLILPCFLTESVRAKYIFINKFCHARIFLILLCIIRQIFCRCQKRLSYL